MAFFFRKKKKQRKMKPWISPEEQAAGLLSIALSEKGGEQDERIIILDEDLQRKKIQEQKQKDSVEEDISEAAVEAAQSERQNLRVLVITDEVSLFITGSARATEYVALANYLDELHIIVLTVRRDASYKSRRIAPNVWVYPTNSRSRLFALYNAYTIAKKQLAFAAGFRADSIIATDGFEAGTAAYAIAKRYARPLQLQISVDPFETEYIQEHPGNKWRVLAARFVIPRADCIMARSKRLAAVLEKRYRGMKERMTVLPPFLNLVSFRDAVPVFDLRTRYPQLKFIILVVSRLDARSQVELALNACTPVLRQYPTIGLVIVGEGPLRRELEKKVLGAGLQNRIVFEPETNELVSFMKSSNLFLNVGQDEEHDTVLAAAAAGLPVLTVAGDTASALFKDGVDAFVCPKNDMVCLQARLGEFLNDNQLRTAFSINGRDRVFSVTEQDVEAYRKTMVESFESCVLKTYSGK